MDSSTPFSCVKGGDAGQRVGSKAGSDHLANVRCHYAPHSYQAGKQK